MRPASVGGLGNEASLPSGLRVPAVAEPVRRQAKRKPTQPDPRIHRATVIVSAANLAGCRRRCPVAVAPHGRARDGEGFCEFAIHARRTSFERRGPALLRDPAARRVRRRRKRSRLLRRPCRGQRGASHIAPTTWATASGTSSRAQGGIVFGARALTTSSAPERASRGRCPTRARMPSSAQTPLGPASDRRVSRARASPRTSCPTTSGSSPERRGRPSREVMPTRRARIAGAPVRHRSIQESPAPRRRSQRQHSERRDLIRLGHHWRTHGQPTH